jgi:hypothetical protein
MRRSLSRPLSADCDRSTPVAINLGISQVGLWRFACKQWGYVESPGNGSNLTVVCVAVFADKKRKLCTVQPDISRPLSADLSGGLLKFRLLP